jgi:hypothetical protein
MSLLRPAARVRAPDGSEWEIYAYKLRPRDRRRAVVRGPRRLLRVVAAARAAVRALGSDEWTIEAITFMPQRQSYRWQTTGEFRGQVLAQVEGSLARGDLPANLRNAIYSGLSRSAR